MERQCRRIAPGAWTAHPELVEGPSPLRPPSSFRRRPEPRGGAVRSSPRGYGGAAPRRKNSGAGPRGGARAALPPGGWAHPTSSVGKLAGPLRPHRPYDRNKFGPSPTPESYGCGACPAAFPARIPRQRGARGETPLAMALGDVPPVTKKPPRVGGWAQPTSTVGKLSQPLRLHRPYDRNKLRHSPTPQAEGAGQALPPCSPPPFLLESHEQTAGPTGEAPNG